MPIKIVGKEELLRKVRALSPRVAVAMGEVNRQSAGEMADLARSLVPVKSGVLRGSIRVEPGSRPGAYVVKAGGPTTTKSVRTGSGRPFDYALGVEFGTKAHVNAGMFAGSDHPGARKHPFWWVSWRMLRKRIRARASRALKKAVASVMGR